MKLTLKKLNEEHYGCYEYKRTDNHGVTYSVKIFSVGYAVHVKVYSKNNELIFHKERWCDKFADAVKVFNGTCRKVNDDNDKIHTMFCSKCYVNYIEVKKAVEQWIVDNKQTFTLGDCQQIADRWENRSLAMEYAYTAACYFENCPNEESFRRRNNFRVDFRL